MMNRLQAVLHAARAQTALSSNWPLVVGAILVALVVLVAVAGPWLAPQDPMARTSVLNIGGEWVGPPFPAFSNGFLLGSDRAGRDIFSRLLWAVRPTLGHGRHHRCRTPAARACASAWQRATVPGVGQRCAVGRHAPGAGRTGPGRRPGDDCVRRHPARPACVSARPQPDRLGRNRPLCRNPDACHSPAALYGGGARAWARRRPTR